MSFYPTKYSQGELLSKAATHLKAVGYDVNIKGYTLEAVDGKDYSKLTVLFFLWFFPLGIVLFLIYWFTRKKNRITLDATSEGSFIITYYGRKAAKDAKKLSNTFSNQNY